MWLNLMWALGIYYIIGTPPTHLQTAELDVEHNLDSSNEKTIKILQPCISPTHLDMFADEKH